jgi:acyl-CoA reductase-like NAD-dependent aldehyde dehydrogenase
MRCANFIDGQWVLTGVERPNVNPSDLDDEIGTFDQAKASDAHDAIAAAQCAYASWQFSGIQERSDALDTIGTEILERKAELGELLSREEGKTRREGFAEVERAGRVFKFFAGEALRLQGEILPSSRTGMTVQVTREPLGVIGVISPWNFPLAIPAWKIAPAICYGNTVVFKPAELVPASAWLLVDIIRRSGLPPGVFNLVFGAGSEVGDAIVKSPAVTAITFTGSNAIGMKIAAAAVARGAKVQTEMGGKNPLVVLDDADLDLAVDVAVQGAFFSTGQRCTASSRLIVTRGIHDAFVERMTRALAALRVGHALEAKTDIGPVVDEVQLKQDLRYIELGRAAGATLAFGGRLLERPQRGYYLEPALFVDTAPDMLINQDEIFGPIAAVIRVENYDEALHVANATPFGLSSGIVTKSLRHTADFQRKSQAGMVMVNAPTAGVDYHVPFGGRKQSSYGPREQGRYAAEFFTTVKTTYIAP